MGAAAWLHDNRVFQRLAIIFRAVYQFEEMAVQVDRMRHHRIIDELDPDPFIEREADGIICDGRKFLAVKGPHIALHVPG